MHSLSPTKPLIPQGSYQMGRVVGTPPSPPPPMSPPSVGFSGGLSPPDPPPCSSSKGTGHQNVSFHTRMIGHSIFPNSKTEGLARGRAIRLSGPIPKCLALQSFQIHESYRNARSFNIPRFAGYTRMLGPSVIPDSHTEGLARGRVLF